MASFSNRIFLLVSLTLMFSGGATRLVTNETGGTRGDFVISPYKTVVQVFNRLNSTSFTIHCKSKDDDMGTHVVGPKGNYQFKFRANFWGTTLFFCGVSCAKGWTAFVVYSIKRDIDRCQTYSMWEVRSDGVYGFRQQDKVCDLRFPFKNKP
ncbi:hypothetical protein BT93_H0457 [Corymbia citriodora subsp. variegata]|nr:hypothetical protein BT93_H0457 [Corymbia citriodora subsp. variegata]